MVTLNGAGGKDSFEFQVWELGREAQMRVIQGNGFSILMPAMR